MDATTIEIGGESYAIGDCVLFGRLGAATITAFSQRDARRYIVLTMPREGSALVSSVPVDDGQLAARITRLASAEEVQAAVASIVTGRPAVLPSAFIARRRYVQERLRGARPGVQAALLCAYAAARQSDFVFTHSDTELVRTIMDLLTVELACAAGMELADARDAVAASYAARVKRSSRRRRR